MKSFFNHFLLIGGTPLFGWGILILLIVIEVQLRNLYHKGCIYIHLLNTSPATYNSISKFNNISNFSSINELNDSYYFKHVTHQIKFLWASTSIGISLIIASFVYQIVRWAKSKREIGKEKKSALHKVTSYNTIHQNNSPKMFSKPENLQLDTIFMKGVKQMATNTRCKASNSRTSKAQSLDLVKNNRQNRISKTFSINEFLPDKEVKFTSSVESENSLENFLSKYKSRRAQLLHKMEMYYLQKH